MEYIDWLTNELKRVVVFGAEYTWLVKVFLIVLLTLIANAIIKNVLDRLALASEKTRTTFDNILVITARKPVRIFIWIWGILLAVEVLPLTKAQPSLGIIVAQVREVSFVVLFSWFVVRVISRGEDAVQRKGVLTTPMDATTASALGKLLRLAVTITTTLVVLQTLGFSVSAILAFGGVGGIAVGFAAKDLLANFFGGLMLYLDQPFRVGDWIRSPDKKIEGTVESIGWRLTRIRTFDKRPLYVPNATFANISVENPSRMTNRRIKETIGLRYDDANKAAKIVADVKRMLEGHQDIDSSQTLIVNINAFSPSSLDFFIYTFTKTTDWVAFHDIKQDVMIKIIEIVEDNGAELAYPTQTLNLKTQLPANELHPVE